MVYFGVHEKKNNGKFGFKKNKQSFFVPYEIFMTAYLPKAAFINLIIRLSAAAGARKRCNGR